MAEKPGVTIPPLVLFLVTLGGSACWAGLIWLGVVLFQWIFRG